MMLSMTLSLRFHQYRTRDLVVIKKHQWISQTCPLSTEHTLGKTKLWGHWHTSEQHISLLFQFKFGISRTILASQNFLTRFLNRTTHFRVGQNFSSVARHLPCSVRGEQRPIICAWMAVGWSDEFSVFPLYSFYSRASLPLNSVPLCEKREKRTYITLGGNYHRPTQRLKLFLHRDLASASCWRQCDSGWKMTPFAAKLVFS